jgi:hypothetical protein
MSQHTTKLARNFLLKIGAEQAQQIDEFRWAHRQQSQTAAVRKLIALGLAAAQQTQEPLAA